MPPWMDDFVKAEKSISTNAMPSLPVLPDLPPQVSPTPIPNIVRIPAICHEDALWKAHVKSLAKVRDDLVNEHELAIQWKDGVIQALKVTFTIKEKEMQAQIKQANDDNERLKQQVKELEEQLLELRREKGKPLRYNDLYSGGILSKYVDAFTFLSSVELNNEWLKLVNYTDGIRSFEKDDGLCENLRRHSKVMMDKCKGTVPHLLLEPGSPLYRRWLKKRTKARARLKNVINWKDKYLVFCLYVRSRVTQKFCASVFGIGMGNVSDVFYLWAHIMDSAMCEIFPRPTCSQMLRAYPSCFIEADGDAR